MTTEPSRALLRRSGPFVLYLLPAIALLGAGYLFREPLALILVKIQQTVAGLGPAAPAIMVGVCGIWGVLCLPGPLLQTTVAAMFSATPGTALTVVVLGETLAQSAAFSLARHGGRCRVRERLSGQRWFARLEDQTERRGTYGVFLFRVMPFFPNSLASYAFGLTPLSFWPYLGASWLGSLPKMAFYIFGTTSFLGWLRSGSMTLQGVLTVAVALSAVTLLARAWQRRLRRVVESV